MSAKEYKGKCAICGLYGQLTFEHIPPKAALNSTPVFMQNHDNLVDEDHLLYGKGYKSNRGFGGYTLCQKCNNLTGSWYSKAFADFVNQGKAVIRGHGEINQVVTGSYNIKPLSVIKQVLAMFMSADRGGYLRSQSGLVNFILKKEQLLVPPQFKVYLYSTISNHYRMFGYCNVYDPESGIKRWSEINFPPFGYFLTEDSPPPNKIMLDITSWGTVNYNQTVTVDMTTAYLTVKNPMIGIYGE